MRSLSTTIRSRIRAILVAHGPMTCSNLVRTMGLDPARHKGTIHALMVDLETEGVLGATMKGNRRDRWFIHTDRIRNRKRIMTDLNTAAASYAAAVRALKNAESAKRDAAAALMQAMQSADVTSAVTESGKVSICAGRRTVKVTCKALQAEIKLMQERAVRTGRAVESIGDPYVMLR